MSSPISSSSEYNTALDQTLNSSIGSERLNVSDLSQSDIENVNLPRDWNDMFGGKQRKDPRDSSRQLLDSLRNNNVSQNGGSPLDTTLDNTMSTLSLDLSATGSEDATTTLSFIESPDEVSPSDEELTGSTPHPPSAEPASVPTSKPDSTSTRDDSKDTTANVSLLPVDPAGGIRVYDNLEEFDRNLPSTVTLLTTPKGSKVYLVGTAHFSESSQNDVSYVMRNVRPNVVMLELCPSRVHILRYDERTLLEETKELDLPKIRGIIKTNGVINGMFYILLLNMNAKITKKLGMAPGGEFRRAFEEAVRLKDCLVQLGDRQINITLQRALRGLSLWQTMKLIPKLLFMNDDISVEEVEQCKNKDLLEKIMLEMADEFPAIGRVFVQERDLYLCHSLQKAARPILLPDGKEQPVRVVGVVGLGHACGIAKHWGQVDLESIASIVTIPPASVGHRVLKYTLKYGLLSLACYGVFRYAGSRFPVISSVGRAPLNYVKSLFLFPIEPRVTLR